MACHRFGPAEQAGHPGNPFSEATVLGAAKAVSTARPRSPGAPPPRLSTALPCRCKINHSALFSAPNMKTRIAIRHSLHLLLALLALAPLASFAAEYPSLREALRKETPVNPATFKISNEVVVFDLWKYFEKAGITDTQERGDVVYFVVALQGIVNRERPRLYLLTTLATFRDGDAWLSGHLQRAASRHAANESRRFLAERI